MAKKPPVTAEYIVLHKDLFIENARMVSRIYMKVLRILHYVISVILIQCFCVFRLVSSFVGGNFNCKGCLNVYLYQVQGLLCNVRRPRLVAHQVMNSTKMGTGGCRRMQSPALWSRLSSQLGFFLGIKLEVYSSRGWCTSSGLLESGWEFWCW